MKSCNVINPIQLSKCTIFIRYNNSSANLITCKLNKIFIPKAIHFGNGTASTVPNSYNSYHSSGLLLRRKRNFRLTTFSKMIVPGFGEKSPEAKAADSLHNFFTYLSVRIVLSQLQSYNPDAYKDLMEFTENNPLKDGDNFCANLMRTSPNHQKLALRIMEVRSAYANEDFEWENLRIVSKKVMEDSNMKLLRDFVVETSKLD